MCTVKDDALKPNFSEFLRACTCMTVHGGLFKHRFDGCNLQSQTKMAMKRDYAITEAASEADLRREILDIAIVAWLNCSASNETVRALKIQS